MQEAALEPGTSVFADQFENTANFRAHLKTGEEVWQQTGGALDAFVSGAGTGGTIAGVSHQLKSRNPAVQVHSLPCCIRALQRAHQHRGPPQYWQWCCVHHGIPWIVPRWGTRGAPLL